jgi:hypothetical protein
VYGHTPFNAIRGEVQLSSKKNFIYLKNKRFI